MNEYNEKQRDLITVFSCSVSSLKYDNQEEINGAAKLLEDLLIYYSNKN